MSASQDGGTFGCQEPRPSAERQLSRRAALARGTLALAAACSLTACGARPQPVAASARPPRPEPELGNLRYGGAELAVAGEPLNGAALRRFYARHGYERVWTNRQEQAASLVNAVARAGDHGLDPEQFHAGLLLRSASLPALRRDLLLSDAFLSYASALSSGGVPVERRRDGEALSPDPIDLAAALDAAIDSPDPGAAIEALAPTTPTYRELRQALRRHRSGAQPRGRTAGNRLREIEVNLERQRWLPRSLPADRVWVNIADQKLILYRADRPVFSTRVVVGAAVESKQSPEFRTAIEASFFNPPWIIPSDIVEAEYLPRLMRDPDYLTRHNMILRDNGEIEQLPGPNAGLGAIMFDMPNRFDVYLHDTPDKHLFRRPNRRISHGCIRVENPREFAALLMQQPIGAIDERIATGSTTRTVLPTPVPVFVVYQTAFVEAGGALQTRPDFYGRDAAIWQQLRRRSEA